MGVGVCGIVHFSRLSDDERQGSTGSVVVAGGSTTGVVVVAVGTTTGVVVAVGAVVGVAVGAADTSMVIESSTSVLPSCLVFKVTLPLPAGLQPIRLHDLADLVELRGPVSTWHEPWRAKSSWPLVTMYTL